MIKKSRVTKFLILVAIILMLFATSFSSANISGNNSKCIISEKHVGLTDFTKETYEVQTKDRAIITLTRYVGSKRPSIMLVHGMAVNHKIFDWDENHSLARFLNNDGWDVWMLDLRTHDGDGDFIFDRNSDREYINRYWDFDKTLLKIDVVKAVDFIKEKSGNETIFFMGHSYGGYLAYAYAEMIGNENLSGIITTGSSAYGIPKDMADNQTRTMRKYGIKIGNRAFVRPFGKPRLHVPKIVINLMIKRLEGKNSSSHVFYMNNTPSYIKKQFAYSLDDEPAGVCVDMLFGKDPNMYNDHWVDPQTLYDYSANLNKITTPLLAIAGSVDLEDPAKGINKTVENVSSEIKKFINIPKYGHLDLLLSDNASILVYPEITNWLNFLIE